MIFNQTHYCLQTDCCLCAGDSGGKSLVCDRCWADLLVQGPVCPRCGRDVTWLGACPKCFNAASAIDKTTALAPYRFPMDRLLLSLKYDNRVQLAREFGQRLAERVLSEQQTLPDYIVPVPLHPLRLIKRGYNQALEIARTVAAQLAVPVYHHSVRRTRNTKPQFELSPEARSKNVKNVFSVSRVGEGSSIAIVDDIVTTGHTANELAMQLKRTGVKEIRLWACANARH